MKYKTLKMWLAVLYPIMTFYPSFELARVILLYQKVWPGYAQANIFTLRLELFGIFLSYAVSLFAFYFILTRRHDNAGEFK